MVEGLGFGPRLRVSVNHMGQVWGSETCETTVNIHNVVEISVVNFSF